MNTHPLSCLVLPALAASLAAQTIAGGFSPNPVAPGVPVTLTCTDAAGFGLQLPSPCSWFTIHQGSQTGPAIQLGLACPTVIVPVAPHGTFSFAWDQRDATGAFVPPGTYWFEARAWDNGFFVLHRDWFCISIQPAGAPALTAAGPARIGLQTPLQISAPTEPGAIWVAAASLSSNDPIVAPGLATCLSEPLFLGPFTSPIGVLDGGGNSSGLELIVPGAPIVLYQGLHVQALLFGSTGLALTNDVSFTIQP
ncbi:MAG TPA: hypothetical protein VFZ65_09255 [Planctomycetota bacterium]|nr:hypothetical protein [Planctomycetota bacterium]